MAFLLDIMWGSVALPAREVVETLLGQSSDTTNSYIVLSFRLPKALTPSSLEQVSPSLVC